MGVTDRTPIHGVAAAVLDRIAELRPDLLSTAEAAAYRLGGRDMAAEAADARLAELRARGRSGRRVHDGPPMRDAGSDLK